MPQPCRLAGGWEVERKSGHGAKRTICSPKGHGHPHRHWPYPQGLPLALCPHAKGLQEA